MGRGRKLTLAEIRTILKLNEEHYSVTKIAGTVDKNRKVIGNLLKDPDNYENRKNYGRLQLIARDIRNSVKFKLQALQKELELKS